MELTELPGCCGVGAVYDFRWERPTKATRRELKKLLKIADQEPDDEGECDGYGTVYATLNSRQVNLQGLDTLLLEHGFVQEYEFVNPKTLNVVYVFSRHRPS